jgi:hypothetical protein
MISMKRISIALALPFIAATAHAEGPTADIPPSAVKQLAEDLDQLQAKVLATQREAEREQQAAADHPRQVVVTTGSAKVFAGASHASRVLTSIKQGTAVPVVDRAGDWYAIGVSAGKDSDGLGAVGGYKETAGWVNAKDVAPKYVPFKVEYTAGQPYVGETLTMFPDRPDSPAPQKTSSSGGSIFQTLTESAAAFRAKYRSNPYFKVTGFAVNTTPPGLTLNFEFK